jgi:hypothetical protein
MLNLDAIVALAQSIKDSCPIECSVLIFDHEGRMIHYVPSDTLKEVAAKMRLGNIAADKGPIGECVRTRKIVRTVQQASVFGYKLKTVVCPVFDANGEFLGGICTSTNMNAQETLHTAAQTIAATSEEMTATTEELGATAEHLAGNLDKVRKGGERVLAEIAKTDNILKFVSSVAANSNLLGLNAAIEAARAGDQGRGFAVVAEEIRKMAINSAQSATEIKNILRGIHNETKNVVSTIASAADLSERQAAATNEISATMQSISATANDIERIADTL